MTAALLPVTSLPPRGRQRRRRVPTPVLLASLAVALLLLYMAEQQAAALLARSPSRVPLPPPEMPGPTPEKIARWREYAAARRCSLADADYAPIFEQLAPFRAAGGVTPALITKALDALDPQRYYAAIARLEVRNGTARVTKGNAADQNLGLLFGMLPGFVTELPDMDVVINLFDEPAVWTAPVPPEVDRAVRSRAVQVGDAFARHGCDGAPGPGGAVLAAARAQRLHATFARSTSMGPFARGLLPVFSWSTIPGCFGDILFPFKSVNDPADLAALLHNDTCPFGHTPWEQKKSVAYWRGTSTGAWAEVNTPAEVWRSFHRERLVSYSKAHPQAVDAAFTRFLNCAPEQCAAMEAEFGAAPTDEFVRSADAHRYVVSVDGNGYAMRNRGVLCSGSLALLGGVFTSWFSPRLQPGVHYLPISLDYSDLADQVEWAQQHDAEARQIATAGAELARTRLREDDAACYWYRLLLEYGAIYNNGTITAP